MLARFMAVLLLGFSASLLWYVFLAPGPTGVSDSDSTQSARYEERDWHQEREDSLNISLFTFRDRNRNGEYDLGDLPMAAVAVELWQGPEGGASHRMNSNINGYANFKMEYGNPGQPISEAGKPYRFQVHAPPGWQITSGNAEQLIEFRRLPGSVAGLIAEPPPHWVGLAPDLTVGLSFVKDNGEPVAEGLLLQVTGPGGEARELRPDADGGVRFGAFPGTWRLRAHIEEGDWSYERAVTVVDTPVELMPIVLGAQRLQALEHRAAEDFEWLNRSIIDKIPNGHLNLGWDYLLAVDNQYYRGPGYVNGLVSGHAVAYNSSGHPVEVSGRDGQPFDFVGGYFSTAWPQSQGELLDIVAWRGQTVVARKALRLSYLGPVWLDADLRRIDRLELKTRHYWQFVADDLEFRLTAPVAK